MPTLFTLSMAASAIFKASWCRVFEFFSVKLVRGDSLWFAMYPPTRPIFHQSFYREGTMCIPRKDVVFATPMGESKRRPCIVRLALEIQDFAWHRVLKCITQNKKKTATFFSTLSISCFCQLKLYDGTKIFGLYNHIHVIRDMGLYFCRYNKKERQKTFIMLVTMVCDNPLIVLLGLLVTSDFW